MKKALILLCLILLPLATADIGFEEQDYGVHFETPELTSTSTSSGNFTNLSQLYDTTITTPADGEVLTWSSAVMQWVNSAVGSASKWIFGSSPYWYNDSDTVYFNETKLNDTIDARAGSGTNYWQTDGTEIYNETINNMSLGTSDAKIEINNDGEFTFWGG